MTTAVNVKAWDRQSVRVGLTRRYLRLSFGDGEFSFDTSSLRCRRCCCTLQVVSPCSLLGYML